MFRLVRHLLMVAGFALSWVLVACSAVPGVTREAPSSDLSSSTPSPAAPPSTGMVGPTSGAFPPRVLGGPEQTCLKATWDTWREALSPYVAERLADPVATVTPDGAYVVGKRLDSSTLENGVLFREPGQPDRVLDTVTDSGMIVAAASDDNNVVVAYTDDPGNHHLVQAWKLVHWDRATWTPTILEQTPKRPDQISAYPTVLIRDGNVYWTGQGVVLGPLDLKVRHTDGRVERLVQGINSALIAVDDLLIGNRPGSKPGYPRGLWAYDRTRQQEVAVPATFNGLLPIHSGAGSGGSAYAVHMQPEGRFLSEIWAASKSEPARLIMKNSVESATVDRLSADGPWVGVDSDTGHVLIDTRTWSYAYLDVYFGTLENGYLNLGERTYKDRYLIPISALPPLPPC